MAYQKQNFKVQQFKDWVNQQLKGTDDFANDDFKAGLCAAIEHVLMKSNQYNGFSMNYWLDTGKMEWIQAGRPEDDKEKFIYGPTGQKYNRIYH